MKLSMTEMNISVNKVKSYSLNPKSPNISSEV